MRDLVSRYFLHLTLFSVPASGLSELYDILQTRAVPAAHIGTLEVPLKVNLIGNPVYWHFEAPLLGIPLYKLKVKVSCWAASSSWPMLPGSGHVSPQRIRTLERSHQGLGFRD